MHGRREGEQESRSSKRLPLCQHMCPLLAVDSDKSSPAAPSATRDLPSPSPPPPPPPPPPASPAAAAASRSRSLSPASDFFLKDGREIRSGDCALFQAGNAPPFIGLVRWFKPGEKEQFPKLCVSWLYRPSDIKLSKGAQLNAAPNEVFYSFHTDVISSASILHPCKVAFLRKGIELPSGTSSFVCWRVYDIENKCLWWLTDKDYINERQEEVDWLLERSRKEMHAAVQSGGRSPKPLNGPSSSQQIKSGSDSSQNMGTGSPSFPSSQPKGKKRERSDQIAEPANKRELRERSTSANVKSDDADPASFKFDSMKAEIAKMTEKGGLVDTEAVDKLVSLIQMDRTERKLDMAARVMLADVIAATNRDECLDRFVQLKGVPVLDDWLQEASKAGKQSGDSGSPKVGDSGIKLIEDLLVALLRALDKLPVNLNALRTCNIGKTVNQMKNHKNIDIQRKARNLVDTWKKRVDAEMKNNEGKVAGSGQAVSWQGKQGFLEGPHAGNRRSGSTEPAIGCPASHLVVSKSLPAKTMLTPVALVPSKAQSPLSGASAYKQTGAGNSSSEPPPATGEEKSTSSSQSQNNSQSCSSDHAKAVGGSSWKEDARTSTAGSMHTGKTSGSSSRHRRSANGPGSGSLKESNTNLGKSGSLDRTGALEKTSESALASEKPVDTLSTVPDHGNSQNRLILRIINPGRSPARGGTGSSGATTEDPPTSITEKHDNDPKSNDAKDGAVAADEGDRSSSVAEEEAGKAAQGLKTGCSSSGTEKTPRNSFSSMNALVESCVKYSEASTPPQAGDDMGMNLLASVATGEISKSELTSSSKSPVVSPDLQCEGSQNKGKATGKCNESASTPNEESKAGLPLHQSKVKPEDGDKPPIASLNAHKEIDPVRKLGGSVTVKQEHEKRNVSPVAKEDNKSKSTANEKTEGSTGDADQERKEHFKATTKKETTGDENLPVQKSENKTVASLEGSKLESMDDKSKDGNVTAPGAMEARTKECSSEQINKEATIKAESDVPGGKKENNPVSAKPGSDVTTMFDFDLNEGVQSEDVQQCEPVTTTAPRPFPAGDQMRSLSAFLPHASSSSVHAPITVVAAPAKGSFVPPETLLPRSNKGETGWKGSAATSAFRPAEPRKVLEMQLGCASDAVRASSDNTSKHSRPLLEIDLNVADERIIEEEVSQSSAQTTGSARGFDLDLNRADVEVQENGLFLSNNSITSNNNNIPGRRVEVPLLPLRPISIGLHSNSDTEANGLRDFDLNSGPGLDEAGSEPVPRAQITRNNVNSNAPFLQPPGGLRMNNGEMGNMSSWFPPGNSYPAVAIPSFLPERPGEQPQPYPIVAAPQGAQRILGPVPGSGPHPFGNEAYRGPPVLSSSPAGMAFSPAAFSYSNFPFGSAFPLGSASFPGGSAPNYAESSSAIPPMFPAMPTQLMGPTGATGISSHFPPPRPYLINLPESSSSSGGGGGHDSSRRWVRQGGSSSGGLDLNSGPGGADVESKDDKVGPIPRQIIGGVSPQVFAEEQARMFQMAPGAALKRKEPEGGWDPERSPYKFSWQ